MHDIINRVYGAFVAILRDEEVYMVRIKGKKFLAIAIAGAVFVGGVFPETACAAETAESTSDVQVEETKQQSVKSIQENLLEAYNTGFESSDSNGLYWWSDGNWGKENIAQKAYEGDQKPAEDSGGYYVEVTPDGEGIGTAQICAGDIASILEPEVSYEFSFYAKADPQTPEGTVELQITSASSDWASSQAAAVTYDSKVILDENWQSISGTFIIPAHEKHEQVKIEFKGSKDLTFYVDDLKIGGKKAEVNQGDNLVKNPGFADEDLSVWKKGSGGAAITSETSGEAIPDGIATYGAIGNRTSSQECFAQDMTGILQSGKTYEYSFRVKLDGEDYRDAPADQREISFAPYVSVGSNQTYWDSYSSGILDDNCVRQIEAGVWTKFNGIFKPQFEGEAEELVIRILEQGTNYGSGDCVKGRYYVTGVEMREKVEEQKEIESDIPDLKSVVSSADGLGADAYTGTCIANGHLSDGTLMKLVEKHFNAVTFENELKMDAVFGYQNDAPPEMESVIWTRADGTVMSGYQVPKMDFTLAEKILAVIKDWNDKNPESAIKIRGHVLVWHSQAPEWFFHEDWNKDKPYASKEVMDARQEWYIQSVLNHFLGKDSPYKDMFYGWDVVNEAVSDSTGTYRKEDEKSSWWKAYGDQDFIINAFRYANHYAPKGLELYYNDYNECSGNKVDGIAKLLTEVKSHEKDADLPTRITGMGMQAHYDMAGPTANQIKNAAVTYGKIVGKVQFTELDLKSSNEYDGTDATRAGEYTKQAYRYKEIYDVLKEVDAMDGIDINGMTVWGVIDKYSWLQDSNSAGGGSDGSKKHVPLLFDDDYKAKPAFYAFADDTRLEPYINNVVVMQALGGDDPYAKSKTYQISGIDDVDASFQIVWEENQMKIKVTVKDETEDGSDGADLYLDWTKGSDGTAKPEKMTIMRSDAQKIDGGYIAEFTVGRELKAADRFAFDVVVTDGEKKAAFNDKKMSQEDSSRYFAVAMTKPYMTVSNGTIAIDGEEDALWGKVAAVPLTIVTGVPEASAAGKLLWDKDYLYLWMEVKDSSLDKSSEAAHVQDSVEIFIDENNHKTDGYEEDDKQYRINYENEPSFNGQKCIADNLISQTRKTEDGYIVEAACKWTDITPEAGTEIGFDMQINDGKGGTRIGTVSWYDESGQGWSSPGVFGTILLLDNSTQKPGSTGKVEGNTSQPGNNATKAPRTGDENRLGLWSALLAISCGAAGTVVYRRKRRLTIKESQ